MSIHSRDIDIGELTFRKWFQHLIAVLAGILIGFAYIFPFLLLISILGVAGHWLGWI